MSYDKVFSDGYKKFLSKNKAVVDCINALPANMDTLVMFTQAVYIASYKEGQQSKEEQIEELKKQILLLEEVV